MNIVNAFLYILCDAVYIRTVKAAQFIRLTQIFDVVFAGANFL